MKRSFSPQVLPAVRILAALLLILFFVPAFTVSCSDIRMEISVSAADAATGIKADVLGSREELSEPVPVLFLLLILPAAVLFLSLVRKEAVRRMMAPIALAASLADLILWIVFRRGVERAALENYFSFSSRAGFFLSVAASGAVCVLGAAALAGFPGGAHTEWYCPMCGRRMRPEARFCTQCGEKRPGRTGAGPA